MVAKQWTDRKPVGVALPLLAHGTHLGNADGVPDARRGKTPLQPPSFQTKPIQRTLQHSVRIEGASLDLGDADS
jgi:hypothetical protein